MLAIWRVLSQARMRVRDGDGNGEVMVLDDMVLGKGG